jgi:sulfur-oxidizing protein SoxY
MSKYFDDSAPSAESFLLHTLNRRELLLSGTAGIIAFAIPLSAHARPTLDEALRSFTGGAEVRAGRVKFEISPLVENGNAVPVSVDVESPMTAVDHVRRIALFNEKNPQADIAIFHLNVRAGRARIATRIRLATSQVVVAAAELSDGSFWMSKASVIVTLAACIEDVSKS